MKNDYRRGTNELTNAQIVHKVAYYSYFIHKSFNNGTYRTRKIRAYYEDVAKKRGIDLNSKESRVIEDELWKKLDNL